jgi:hypothetical protein
MTMMIREERCVSDGLLLEGKKKKPWNLLQILGFDHYKEARSFEQLFQLFLFQNRSKKIQSQEKSRMFEKNLKMK